MSELLRALILFGLAGLAENGGGWCVWQFLREGRAWPVGMLGAAVLVLYGVIPTFQSDPHFGRVDAAYGGEFVVLSLTWGRIVDGFVPDGWDSIWRWRLPLGRVDHLLRPPRALTCLGRATRLPFARDLRAQSPPVGSRHLFNPAKRYASALV